VSIAGNVSCRKQIGYLKVSRALYGCETWSLKFGKERSLSVFQNRLLRNIFGTKRDEVTGEWRKLHNEGLNYLYSSLNIARVNK
jgi:hypothetical protein